MRTLGAIALVLWIIIGTAYGIYCLFVGWYLRPNEDAVKFGGYILLVTYSFGAWMWACYCSARTEPVYKPKR